MIILILIIIGYCATKAGMISAGTRTDITNFVIYFVLPCSIFSSFHKGISTETLEQCAVVLGAALGLQVLYIILNKFLYIKFSPEKRVIAKYATIVNNASFMGLPVIESVFGEVGLLYGAIVLIPMRIFMWTEGLSLFTKTDTKQKVKVFATHPCIWAVIVGFVYAFTPVELPGFISGTISAIGDCNLVLSMVVVGSILTGVNPKEMLDKDCLYYSVIRLAAIPALVFGILTLLGADEITVGSVVLSAAMPAAVTTAMLAEKYGKDSTFASKMIFTSTLLSIVTLTVLAELLT